MSRTLAIASLLLLAACGDSGLVTGAAPGAPPAPPATPPVTPPAAPPATTVIDPATLVFKAGSAQRVVNPTPVQIAGVTAGTAPDTYLQQFNLGGYGGASVPDSLPGVLHFDIGGDPASGNRTPIHLRALVLEGPDATGAARRVAFMTLDAIGAGNLIQKKLTEAVSAASGVAPENVLWGQTHTHSSADLQGLWGGVPRSWLDCTAADAATGCDPALQAGLYQLAASAAAEAVSKLRPAQLKLAATTLDGAARRNNFRRCNPADALAADPHLMVLQAVDAQGAALGTLVQYTAHPTVLGGDNREVHADYVASLASGIERRYGATAVYFNGPIADASPRAPEAADAYARAAALGEALAGDVEAALKAKSRVLNAPLTVASASAFLVAANPLFTGAGAIRAFNGYYEFLPREANALPIPEALKAVLPQTVVGATTTVSRITVGEGASALEIVTIPGEATRSFGESIRARAATPDMMLLGLTHDSLGYIIPADEFGASQLECGQPYEETVSLGAQTAPLLDAQAYGPLFGQSPVPAP